MDSSGHRFKYFSYLKISFRVRWGLERDLVDVARFLIYVTNIRPMQQTFNKIWQLTKGEVDKVHMQTENNV